MNDFLDDFKEWLYTTQRMLMWLALPFFLLAYLPYQIFYKWLWLNKSFRVYRGGAWPWRLRYKEEYAEDKLSSLVRKVQKMAPKGHKDAYFRDFLVRVIRRHRRINRK